ncbi:unnamed protein product [Caenorhabditis sp. 36 PRJEB53466]|nr:unnamed protein product [Caenorhabditis sp. 36 PRJEB53466]
MGAIKCHSLLKTTLKPLNEKETSSMKATLEPSKFLEEPETLVGNLDCTSEISVNAIFSEIPAQTGSLKHIVQIVANKWLTEMIPDNLRHNFSVSTKPQKPQVSLPSRFINPPIVERSKFTDATEKRWRSLWRCSSSITWITASVTPVIACRSRKRTRIRVLRYAVNLENAVHLVHSLIRLIRVPISLDLFRKYGIREL